LEIAMGGTTVTGFSPNSGSWFEINGTTYSTQNSNDVHSVGLTGGTFRFEVRPDDHWAKDSGSSERSEIRGETVYAPGEVLNISYTFMIEPGAANTATGRGGDGSWLILGQFHANDWESQSPFAIEMLKEKMAIVIRYGDPVDHEYRELFVDTKDIERGRYYEMDIEVRFENNGNGFLNVWRDGEKIVSYSGPIGYDNGVYWKYGVYRSEADGSIVVNYTDMSVGKAGSGNGVLIVGTPVGDEITAATAPAGQPTVTDKGDTIASGGGSDVTVAGSGDDKVLGSRGKDTLNGGAGDDIVKGGSGNDKIDGRSGDDVLVGGKGKDAFVFSNGFGNDRIADFRPGQDVIRFDKAIFADYAAMKGAMSSHGGGVLIEADEGSVFLSKVGLQKINAGDFIFA